MKQWRFGVIIMAVLVLSLSCGSSVVSPAPGCNTGGGCFPVMGGCFGKTVIEDLAVTGGGECLKVRVNNCNGGVITIDNGCDEALVFGELEIPPGVRRTVDIHQRPDGQYEFIEGGLNFSDFIPETDQFIEVTGMLGDQTVRISFIKTARLCE